MKKFRIIFTDILTGLDLYNNAVVEAGTMSLVANHLERLGVSFRLIEEVTNQYAAHFFCHALTGDFIPREAKI